MIDSFLFEIEAAQVIDPVAAGQTLVSSNSAPLDVRDCDAYAIMVAVGSIADTGTVDIKLKQGNLADGSDLADVKDSAQPQMSTADDNKNVIIEVVRHRGSYGFVSPNITRGTANSDIRGVYLFKYKKRVTPVTQGAKIFASKQLGSPANGTA